MMDISVNQLEQKILEITGNPVTGAIRDNSRAIAIGIHELITGPTKKNTRVLSSGEIPAAEQK